MDLCSHGGEIPMEIRRKYEETSSGLQLPTTTNTDTTDEQEQQQHISIDSNKKRVVGVKYKECLKNHAASIGGNATDGCGEFMPSGEEGTLEGLKCSACNCHRNFHRKEMEGDHYHQQQHQLYNPHHIHLHHQYFKEMNNSNNNNRLGTSTSLIPLPSPHNMIMPLGAMQTSESDEMEMGYSRPPMMKKRFRTKFTAEQKEKMLSFAERVGWRLQKQEESVVQHFCQEIGVRRRVLKVWMHNNKHNLAKKDSIQLDHE